MREYIEKEAVQNLLYDEDAITMLDLAIQNKYPAADVVEADVVEVVRCRDCKHYRPENPVPSRNGKTKYCCRSAFVKVGEMDFCSYGERREEA